MSQLTVGSLDLRQVRNRYLRLTSQPNAAAAAAALASERAASFSPTQRLHPDLLAASQRVQARETSETVPPPRYWTSPRSRGKSVIR